jgi:excisionase family DNA binding protein
MKRFAETLPQAAKEDEVTSFRRRDESTHAEESTVENPHHLTASQAADYLNVPENALAKMRVTGEGPPFAKFGRRVRYGRAALDAWVSSRTYSSTSSAQ